jgi:hypothetical protein
MACAHITNGFLVVSFQNDAENVDFILCLNTFVIFIERFFLCFMIDAREKGHRGDTKLCEFFNFQCLLLSGLDSTKILASRSFLELEIEVMAQSFASDMIIEAEVFVVFAIPFKVIKSYSLIFFDLVKEEKELLRYFDLAEGFILLSLVVSVIQQSIHNPNPEVDPLIGIDWPIIHLIKDSKIRSKGKVLLHGIP